MLQTGIFQSLEILQNQLAVNFHKPHGRLLPDTSRGYKTIRNNGDTTNLCRPTVSTKKFHERVLVAIE